MYICNECRGVFEEPRVEREPHYELDGAPCEEHSVCPYCDSYGYGEALECDGCGEYFNQGIDGYFTDALGRRFCSESCAMDYHEIRKVSAE